jgi:hypothetical protein
MFASFISAAKDGRGRKITIIKILKYIILCIIKEYQWQNKGIV